MKIGERIKEKRLQKNYTLEKLANEIGVTKSTVLKYENGTIAIPSDKIEKIAKALKVSPGILMGWEEENNFRNKLFHGINVSTKDKITFIKSIDKHLKEGMTYEDISKILNFPKLEEIMQGIVFGKDLLQLAKTNKDIFNLLVDTINSATRKIFNNSNLTFNEDDVETNKETFEQIMSEMSTAEILKAELKKYENNSNKNSKDIELCIKRIKDIIKVCKEKKKKYPFDIVYPNGEVVEFKMINKKNYIFTFNVNDSPVEIEYYRFPFRDIPEEKVLYKFLLENGETFFNNPNISILDKEKLIGELQEEFFKAKFNIKKDEK